MVFYSVQYGVLLHNDDKITVVVLTTAGESVSAEAGIVDARGEGVWEDASGPSVSVADEEVGSGVTSPPTAWNSEKRKQA